MLHSERRALLSPAGGSFREGKPAPGISVQGDGKGTRRSRGPAGRGGLEVVIDAQVVAAAIGVAGEALDSEARIDGGHDHGSRVEQVLDVESHSPGAARGRLAVVAELSVPPGDRGPR